MTEVPSSPRTARTLPKQGRRSRRLGSVLGIAGCAFALVAGSAGASTPAQTPEHPHGSHHAVFVQTDGLQANTIVAYDRTEDGALHQAGSYPTGGRGGALVGSVVDHLASQGSLAYDARHQLLFAVNAGSNTISVFAVRGDVLHLQQVVGSGGSFPVSIAVRGDLVFAANALDGGSIDGFVLSDGRLGRVPGWHRSLGLDPAATPQFVNTPGQVVFTPDGSSLVVTTKANGSNIDVFALGPLGRPAAAPVVNAEPGTVPFGATFDAAGHLAVAEAGTDAVTTYLLGRHGVLTRIDTVAVGQQATCWITRVGTVLYASNAGSANLSRVAVGRHGVLDDLGSTSTDAGTVDATATSDGRFLYVQTGAAGRVDGYAVGRGGSLTPVGSVTVPGAVGGEGIVAL